MIRDKWKRRIVEMCVFSMLGALMFCSKVIMEMLPNIHLLGMFVMVFTLTYRTKALIPIYVYVILNGLYAGFNLWWVPYLYIWTVLWAITMILPKKMPKSVACVIYPAVCAIYGLVYGILYAPAEAMMFHLNFEQTVAWVLTGVPFDVLHALGNLCAGLLIVPLTALLTRLSKKIGII